MKDLLIKIEKSFENTRLAKEGGSSFECSDYEGIYSDMQSFLHKSLLQVIERCADRLDELTKKKEQVNGFQPYGHFYGDDEVSQRKIFFDGFDDGRNMMKIDLKDLISKLKQI